MDRRRITIIFMLAIVSLLPVACGLKVSVSSNEGTLSEEIKGADDNTVFGRTVIGAESLSHAIKGGGSLKASYLSAQNDGAYFRSGVDIHEAEQYDYSYELVRESGLFWPEYKHPEIRAQETLDVVNAKRIEAYANAFNANGDMSGVSTLRLDPDRKASLTGYANRAVVSGNRMAAIEDRCEGRCSDEPWSLVQKLLMNPYDPEFYPAAVRAKVFSGQGEGFLDSAWTWAGDPRSGQHNSGTSGDGCRADSRSPTWMGSLFHNLNGTVKAEDNPTIGVNLTGSQPLL